MNIINRKYWIRMDREEYFWDGVLATCVIACFVSLYWQAADRVTAKRSLKLEAPPITDAQESQQLREPGYFNPAMQTGGTQYYRMGEEMRLPTIPDPAKEKNEVQ